MDSKFTWVPLYEELAQALLRYKEDRTELVEWIYEDLGKVTRADAFQEKIQVNFNYSFRFQWYTYS